MKNDAMKNALAGENERPLMLAPAFKDYIWGGERLKRDWGKQTDLSPLAESWELSCHEAGPSVVASGEWAERTLAQVLAAHPQFVGTKAEKAGEFPLLIKLIDAAGPLSVQVHPDDDYAERVEHALGKTEMWYVLDAGEGAGIYYGFKRETTLKEMKAAIESNTLTELLNWVPVKKGECFFILAGTVHAIGAGLLIAEVQQSSNLTYRVYDYGRLGADGKPGEPDEAVRIANDSPYGLSGTVFSADPQRAAGVAARLRVGTVNVNGGVWYSADAPFGGYKQSGNGRDKSLHAFEKYTEVKATWINLAT